jgi:polyhydroxyalkanoate synthesis regulator phasin
MSEEKMGKEPENLMLRILREVREDVRMLKTGTGEIKQRLDEMHETLYTTAGLAMHANVKNDTLSKRVETLEKRIGKLEEKAH